MDITTHSEELIRNLWNPHADDRNKLMIAAGLMREERLGAAALMTGMRMGIALGEAKTPDEAIQRIKAITL